MLLDDDELVSWTEESCSIIAVASAAEPDERIPAVSEWTITDLVAHVAASLAGWFTFNMKKPPGEGDLPAAMESAPPMPDAFEDRLDYLREALATYINLEREMDPATPLAGFWTTVPARSWALRAATEFVVHAWDAQGAIALRWPFPPTPPLHASMKQSGASGLRSSQWASRASSPPSSLQQRR